MDCGTDLGLRCLARGLNGEETKARSNRELLSRRGYLGYRCQQVTAACQQHEDSGHLVWLRMQLACLKWTKKLPESPRRP